MESGLLEVSVEDGRAENGRQIKQDKLCGNNDLIVGVQRHLNSFFTVDYLAVKPHEGTVQVSYLADSRAKEYLEEILFTKSDMNGGKETNLQQ